MTSEKSETGQEIQAENTPEFKKKEAKSTNYPGRFLPRPFDIKERVLSRFIEKDCKRLKQEFKSYGLTEDQVVDFFLQNSGTILSFSMNADDDEPLKFLLEVVPRKALQKVLSKDNFSALESFLLGQVGLEELGLYNSAEEQSQIAKFRVLLSVDENGVIGFMRKNVDNIDLESDTVKANFAKALAEYRQENAPASTVGSPSSS